MKHSKIAVVGAGAVGSTISYALMLRNIATEIMLVDANTQRCKGETLDLSDALSFCTTSEINDVTPEKAGQADIIIIAAGARQMPNQKRSELVQKNFDIISNIIASLQPINKNAIIIMVTNPVDVLTWCVQDKLDLPRNQIFGSGTFLDSKRLQHAIAQKVNIAEQSIDAYVLGEHGDSQFPVWSHAHINSVPLMEFPGITEKDLIALEEETRNKAYNIISCKGATYFGIAACVSSLCEAIIFDQKRIIPVSCYLESMNVCLSMPASIGANGIEQIIPVPLNKHEQERLEKSAAQIKKSRTLCSA